MYKCLQLISLGLRMLKAWVYFIRSGNCVITIYFQIVKTFKVHIVLLKSELSLKVTIKDQGVVFAQNNRLNIDVKVFNDLDSLYRNKLIS